MNYRELNSEDVEIILNNQRRFFDTQETKKVDFRIMQLKKLKSGIKKYENEILDALNKDLGKHPSEGYMTEVGFVYSSIEHMIKNLKKWVKAEKKPSPIFLMPAKSYVVSEPYGSVLIIGPFNYPFQLLIEPLIGAISAGNTAVLKPSEISQCVSKVVKKMINDIFEEEYVACAEGGIETNTALLEGNFDYIFFTGSVNVGRIVMKKASENLIPVTLELGGKSPVIVDESANIKEAAKRIIWGKTVNTGQTCVAPDYIVAHERIKDELIREIKNAIRSFFGEDIEMCSSFGRIINDKHFKRIKNILDKDKEGIVFGGNYNEEKRYIEPTIIDISKITIMDAASMQEEIFGPVMPVISYHSLDNVISEIRKHPKPLALYLFTTSKDIEKKVLNEISSGGVCINDTISYLANPYLPFGGVGASGIGSYHGKDSFITFSHRKSVLKKPAGLGVTGSVLYPPYKKKQIGFIRKILK